MPSSIAQTICSTPGCLLVPLGLCFPSSVGSTVDIRRQSENNKDLSKHNTAKRKKNRWDRALLSLPVLLQTASSRN